MLSYDPGQVPVPEEWLALDSGERRAAVSAWHSERGPDALHPAGGNLAMHVGLHVMVEDQIAAADPASTGLAVQRLCDEGLRRHVALHAIGERLVLQLHAMLHTQAPFDLAAWDETLSKLTAGEVLGQALQRGPPG